MNNFLFVGVYNDSTFNIEFCKAIVDKFSVQHKYSIGEENDYFDFTINPSDAWNGRFLYGGDTIVDHTFVDPISSYTAEVLYMMNRHGFRWSMDKRIEIYYSNITYWMDFLTNKDISAVLFSVWPHETYDYIIYLLARKFGIATVFEFVDGYDDWGNIYWAISDFENIIEEVSYSYRKIEEKLEMLSEDKYTIDNRMTSFIEGTRKAYKSKSNQRIKLMNKRRIEEIHRYFGYANPYNSVSAKLKGVFYYMYGFLATTHLIQSYERLCKRPDYSINYVYYALHYQPEATSSPAGGIFANQILAIKALAKAIPEGWRIYVKEHPHQTRFGRDDSYYTRINSIPNVELISMKIPSNEIIMHSRAVSSLMGTVFLEAAVIGKPCICFGYTPVALINGAYEIRTIFDLRKCIDDILNNRGNIEYEEVKKFLYIKNRICYSKWDYKKKLKCYIDCLSQQLLIGD